MTDFFHHQKLCSSCGWKNKTLKLSDSIFKCQNCDLEIDRDDNAAINIRKEAIEVLTEIGKSSPEFKPVEQMPDVLSAQFAVKQENNYGIHVHKN